MIPCVEGRLDRDDELRNDWENLLSAVLEHVFNTGSCKEVVRVRSLAKSVKEERQVMVKVQLVNLHLPCNLVPFGVKLNSNWEITSLVKLCKLSWLRRSFLGCPSWTWTCSCRTLRWELPEDGSEEDEDER